MLYYCSLDHGIVRCDGFRCLTKHNVSDKSDVVCVFERSVSCVFVLVFLYRESEERLEHTDMVQYGLHSY